MNLVILLVSLLTALLQLIKEIVSFKKKTPNKNMKNGGKTKDVGS